MNRLIKELTRDLKALLLVLPGGLIVYYCLDLFGMSSEVVYAITILLMVMPISIFRASRSFILKGAERDLIIISGTDIKGAQIISGMKMPSDLELLEVYSLAQADDDREEVLQEVLVVDFFKKEQKIIVGDNLFEYSPSTVGV